jgi:integrase
MLVRLGLRSGDVARLRLGDINWNSGTLQVIGKGRYQVRLPLPQDVGDALLRYLECRPANIGTDHVFIRSNAPCRPFASGDVVRDTTVIAYRDGKAEERERTRCPACKIGKMISVEIVQPARLAPMSPRLDSS